MKIWFILFFVFTVITVGSVGAATIIVDDDDSAKFITIQDAGIIQMMAI